ncbi:hypothetical protein FH972_002808 [Carpinus fangiana]|uniref:FAD-binding domain-containing protein n=1 Tax=Carpinus fangiana TaxID=176857 RepID=A0A5N6QJ39_9ROSI|nr:hypothetical protein FH972_002808 [Carpinus fangiana]
MKMQEDQDVVIVGPGIAGLATAVALKKVGIRALVLEKSQGLRATGATLSLYPNAWASLDAFGVSHKLKSFYSPCTRSGAVLRVVHRKALLEALAEELPMETIRFSSNLTSITNQAQEGSSPHVALIKMEDGTTINAKPMGGAWVGHVSPRPWVEPRLQTICDAMHPMTPDLGQNECVALEDALVLGQQLGGLITPKKSCACSGGQSLRKIC